MRIFVVLLLILSPSLLMADDGRDQQHLEQMVASHAIAYKACDQVSKERPPPALEDVRRMARLPAAQLRAYLIYKRELAFSGCLAREGAFPMVFMISLYKKQNLSVSAKNSIENYFDLIADPSLMEAVQVYSSIDPRTLTDLNAMDYFDEPFDMLKVFYSVRSLGRH